MQPIILLGYMGAGKTTIGRTLAQLLGIEFYDLDWYIENRQRQRITQLFESRGEEGFRLVERNMLHEVAEFQDIVLSCGGGTPCFYDNMDYINRCGTSVYLHATADVLIRHLRMAKSRRPLLEGKSAEQLALYIQQSLAQREPFYAQARYSVDVPLLADKERVRQCAMDIIEKVRDETDAPTPDEKNMPTIIAPQKE